MFYILRMRRLFALLALGLTLAGQLQAADCPMGEPPAEDNSSHHHERPATPEDTHSSTDNGCGQLMACGIVCLSAGLSAGPASNEHASGDAVPFSGAYAAPSLGFDPPPPRLRS